MAIITAFKRISDQLTQPLKKSVGRIMPVDKLSGHINQDGIHANHPEEEGPSTISQYINDIIKCSQQDHADPSRMQYKRTAPKILVDGKEKVPALPQD
jgi:hypothetical protein